jgi:hypothetical protein
LLYFLIIGNIMQTLPSELLFLIFHKLTYDTLGKLRQTSKFIAHNLENKYFLREYYKEHVFRSTKIVEERKLSFTQVHHAIFTQRKIIIMHRLLNQVLHIKVNKYAGDRIFINLNPYPCTLSGNGILLTVNKDRLMYELRIRGWRLVLEEENILSYTHIWWPNEEIIKIIYH